MASSSAFLARVAVAVLLVNLFVVILAGLSIRQSHRQFQEGAEITTRNLAKTLKNDLSGAIRSDDIALFAVLDEYRRQRATGSIDGAALNAHIERVRSRLPEINALRITDAQGRVVYGTDVEPGENISLADRPHFIRLRDAPKAGLVISRPQVSRVNQRWVIALARRIDQPDGSFGGMAFATITLEYLARTFFALNVGPRGIVTLRDGDLGIVVRHPEPQGIGSVIGQKTAPPPLQEMVLAGQKSGTYQARSTVDGIERTFSYRQVGDYPLLIVVGLASEDYLAQWRKHAIRLTALVALFALITLAAAWLALRNWKRQASFVEALAEQEAKLRTVADFTFDWEYWQGPNQEIRYMTPSCERVTGYSQAEFIADPGLLLRIIHPEDSYRMDRHLHDINYQEGALVNFRIVRRDGEIRWIAHHCRSVSGRDGEPMGRRISNRDVTAQKQDELTILRESKKNETLLRTAGDGIHVLDLDGNVVQANDAFCRMLGYTPEEMLATNVAQFDAQWSSPELKANIGRLINSSATFATRHRRRDGSIVDVEVNACGVEIGGQILLYCSARDITERVQAESALREKTEALLRSNADLEQFAYSISHDMRQPLRMVTGHLQLLERGLKDTLDQDNRENLAFALDGARRMDAMIVSLLDYSRIGRKTGSKQWMASRESLDEALAFLAPAIEESGAAISVSGAWPRVFASRDELTRLFQNLVGNAVKYRAPDQAPRIEVASGITPQLWRVSVRDHGIGIAPQQIERLFQFFSRLQSRAHYDGTGMGLALCRKIAEHHAGRIWVESAGEGLGSNFIFELPLNPADATAENAEPSLRDPHETS